MNAKPFVSCMEVPAYYWPLDDRVIFNVEYKCYPGRPAKIFGPPENCYPEEYPEVEIHRITTDDARLLRGRDLTDAFSDEALTAIETYILENQE